MNDPRYHSYLVADGHGLAHDPIGAIIGPRPIGWISTVDGAGRRNLAPYSFFNMFNYTPPIVGFSSIGRKDSLRNCEETGAFVCNLATRDLAEAVNQTSINADHGEDEFTLAGLEAAPSTLVLPPRVARSPVALECRLCSIQEFRAADGRPVGSWFVTGEVVAVHIERRLLREGIFDTAAAGPILRAGGPVDYFEITPEARFQMTRPRR